MAYSFAVVYAAYFFSRRATFVQAGIAIVSYAAALLHTDLSFGESAVAWMVTTTILTVVATVVFTLRERSEREIAARRRATEDQERSLSLLQATLESTADGLLVVDGVGRMVSFNQQFIEMWEIPEAIADARDDEKARRFVLDQLVDPSGFAARIEELQRTPEAESFDVLELEDGRVFERYSRPQILDGEVIGRVWSFRDATDSHRFLDRLRKLADNDALTGLFNRRRFEEELKREVASLRRREQPGALLVLDLDNFKFINDTLGHQAGDEVIARVARNVRERLRETDTLARLGGDEFAILLPEAGLEEARAVANSIIEAVRTLAVSAGGQQIRVTASIGVTTFGNRQIDGESLLVEADLAMYDAKAEGRDTVGLYTPMAVQRAQIESRLAWVGRVRGALDRELFTLYSQPVVSVPTGETVQHELLLRMLDNGQVVLPGSFLASAERFGLMPAVDRWVVKEAVDLLAATDPSLQLEVNVSGESIADDALTRALEDELARAGVDPARLIVEVVEQAAIANLDETRRFAQRVKQLGCQFALDDFGAGFGSFYYLKYLPFDYLKIDGDFIHSLPANRTDQLVVQAVADIARGLGKRTIAEFVGDDDTLALLQDCGVDLAQGYHLGRPGPADQLVGTR